MKNLMPARWRPMMHVEGVVLVVVAWLIALLNGPWWHSSLAGRDWSNPSSWLFLACMSVALVALHFVLVAPFANRWTMRPLLSVIVVASAAAAYYMRTYAVLMDPTMMRNVLETDTHEARELITWTMAGWVLLGSALPLVFIWW